MTGKRDVPTMSRSTVSDIANGVTWQIVEASRI